MEIKNKTKDNSDEIFKNLEKLQGASVRWGVIGRENSKKMVWNEFGTDNIPERPAFRITFTDRSTQKEINKATHVAIDQILKGKSFEQAGEGIGEAGLAKLKRTFTSNIPPKNANSTIAKKGQGKNTLYDKGELFRSLNFEVTE